MEDYILHKVVITTEAKFDYASIFNLLEVIDEESFLPSRFQIPDMKKELEYYIQSQKKYWYKHYFKVKYLDEHTGTMLYVFIRPGIVIGKMKNWNVVGICIADDWNEDLEEMGAIKGWLDTKIEDLPDEEDWVEVRYRNKILEKLEMILDIGGRDGFIRCCEELARELSSQFTDIEYDRLTANKIRRYIRSREWGTEKANAIIEALDRLLETERERDNLDDLFARTFHVGSCKNADDSQIQCIPTEGECT